MSIVAFLFCLLLLVLFFIWLRHSIRQSWLDYITYTHKQLAEGKNLTGQVVVAVSKAISVMHCLEGLGRSKKPVISACYTSSKPYQVAEMAKAHEGLAQLIDEVARATKGYSFTSYLHPKTFDVKKDKVIVRCFGVFEKVGRNGTPL